MLFVCYYYYLVQRNLILCLSVRSAHVSRGCSRAHGVVPVLLFLHALLPRVSARGSSSAQSPVRAGHHAHATKLPGISHTATPPRLRPGLPDRDARQSSRRLPLTRPSCSHECLEHFNNLSFQYLRLTPKLVLYFKIFCNFVG